MKRLSLVWILILLSTAVFAQVPTGSITGTVKDEQGAVVPEVMVTLKGVNATRTTTSTKEGEFRFYNLQCIRSFA